MEISLSGRTAIVTGGSKGLGLAIATQFVTSGANVAICARGQQALDEAVKAISSGGAENAAEFPLTGKQHGNVLVSIRLLPGAVRLKP